MWHIYCNERHLWKANTWKCALNLWELAKSGMWHGQIYLTDDQGNILYSIRKYL